MKPWTKQNPCKNCGQTNTSVYRCGNCGTLGCQYCVGHSGSCKVCKKSGKIKKL